MKQLVIAIGLVTLCSSGAAASEESQALSARANIELEAGRVAAGLELLDRAVAADPYDATVRYQRGVQRAKARAFTEAVEDLRAAVAYRQDFSAAQLELGAALVATGNHDEAVNALLAAQAAPALEGQASFFLGVAYLRLNRLDESQASFDRALARDPSLAVAVHYYSGVIAYRRGDFDAAEAKFSAVEREAPTAELGRQSTQFLSVIRRSRPSAYRAFAKVGFEYDSNVVLAPADTTTPGGISQEGDGRFVMNLGGSYVPWSNRYFRLSGSYEFFQGLHFDLTDFNLQDHRPTVQLTFDYGRFSAGLLGRYDYYLRSTDSFLSEGTGFTWGSVRWEGFGRTDIYYRVQGRDYKELAFAVLEGIYQQTGARQFVELGSAARQLWFGYQFDSSHPINGGIDAFEYDAQQVEVGLHWQLPYEVTLETGYRYAHKDYNDASAQFPPTPAQGGRRRRDHDQRVVVGFERPVPEISNNLFVTASYFGTFNQSNKPDFEYDRHIGSIGVEVRL